MHHLVEMFCKNIIAHTNKIAREKPVGYRKFTIDRDRRAGYNEENSIGQFVTILSVNKTRE